MRPDPRIRVYPEYFDSALTRAEGRRLARKHALEAPNLTELKLAAQKLGYKVDTDSESAYSRSWQKKKGLLFISKEGETKELKKTVLLRDLSKTVIEYSRPKIMEYLKQQDQKLKEKKIKPNLQPSLTEKQLQDKKLQQKKPIRRRR